MRMEVAMEKRMLVEMEVGEEGVETAWEGGEEKGGEGDG